MQSQFFIESNSGDDHSHFATSWRSTRATSVGRHGAIYADEFNWDCDFEGLVAQIVAARRIYQAAARPQAVMSQTVEPSVISPSECLLPARGLRKHSVRTWPITGCDHGHLGWRLMMTGQWELRTL
jgi:hypothetical protein